MSKQREALKLALDTLRGWIGIDEWIWPVTAKETCKKNSLEAITAIREALDETEQEPVAWMCADEDMTRKGYSRFSRNCEGEWNIPVYTTPPTRKPLTDEDISAIMQSMATYTWDAHMLARAVERAHGITE